jgi:putative Ca2+/H+ antiporter (TMEM165/GDT1 family)
LFGAIFGAVMTNRGSGDNPQRFMNLVFEGVALASAAITLVAAFYRPWFEKLADQRIFLVVVSTAVILFALQNVARTLDWRKSDQDTTKR